MPPLSFADNAHFAFPDYMSNVDYGVKQLTRCQHERKVDFAQKVRIRQIPQRTTYTREQRESIYYTRTEYKTIRSSLWTELQILENIDAADQAILEEYDEVCSRGLETQTKHGKRQRKQNRILASNTVMGEQAHQKIGDRDEMYLADLYWFRSQNAVRSAIAVAQKDAHEAQMYYLLHETKS
jgi:hypothetical protein